MGKALPNWRLISSVVFAAALVVGAYVLARGIEHPSIAQASTETALLEAIATKDTDGDGLADWEEALYGTDPKNTDSHSLGMTDGDAVAKGLIVPKAVADVPATTGSASSDAPPGAADNTLTAAFSKNFFVLYTNAKRQAGGVALTREQISALADEAFTQLNESVTPSPDFKRAGDIVRGESGNAALIAYAVAAEAVFAAHSANLPKSELDYLEAAIAGDATAVESLKKISAYYRNSAVGLAALAVPPELVAAHLALINGLARLGGTTSDMSRIGADPVATMLALQQYPPALTTMIRAFAEIGKTYTIENIAIPNGTPGGYFINLVQNLEAARKP